ncbi:unnamed protein product [Cuscuta epithymum]|uniref:Uncharacterized protein n=1 Tax=Cuscuta epithymum TaxID=186058 RepID=A0AAV0G5V9_9ASTE|nr:unnamed protein product [Cuscuta epithymum]CAH9143371.1 unnamed protein product [Cuscuta epithymum]
MLQSLPICQYATIIQRTWSALVQNILCGVYLFERAGGALFYQPRRRPFVSATSHRWRRQSQQSKGGPKAYIRRKLDRTTEHTYSELEKPPLMAES